MASLGPDYDYFYKAFARRTAESRVETRQQAACLLFASLNTERLTLEATMPVVLWDEVDVAARGFAR